MPKKAKKDTASSARARARRNGADKPITGIQAIDTVATLKELRKATQHTQDDLAASMGVGQGAISRLEKRDDMLVSTLQHYVEGVGGRLQILAMFPDRPPLIVERLARKAPKSPNDANKGASNGASKNTASNKNRAADAESRPSD